MPDDKPEDLIKYLKESTNEDSLIKKSRNDSTNGNFSKNTDSSNASETSNHYSQIFTKLPEKPIEKPENIEKSEDQ